MYHIAGKFASEERAGQVYTDLEKTLEQQKFYAHVSRLILGSDYYVNLLYDGEENQIPATIKQTINRLLGRGQICQLPEETITVIQQRRTERRAQGVGTFVSHDPTQVSYKTPALRDSETKEIITSFPEQAEITDVKPWVGPLPGSPVYAVGMKDVPRELRPQLAAKIAEVKRMEREKARPFFIRYRAHMEDLINRETFSPALAVWMEQLRTMTPYLFTTSAIQLFHVVWDENKDTFPIPDTDIWVEFISPVETKQGTVKALAITQVNRKSAIEKLERKEPGLKGLSSHSDFSRSDLYRVQIIDNEMQFITTTSYDAELTKWVYVQDCPTHECVEGMKAGEKIIVEPCSNCKARTSFWASWVRTVLLMIEREYATSPDPTPWDTQTAIYEEEGTQKVGKGKNAHIINVTRKREVEYTIISYDISQPEAKYEHTSHQRPQEEKRANWLVLTPKDQIIFQRKRIAAYPRHFKKQEGQYTVAEHDKYVPMLREKKPTIRKVIASIHKQDK